MLESRGGMLERGQELNISSALFCTFLGTGFQTIEERGQTYHHSREQHEDAYG
jgi:hypothetical protein